MAAPPEDDSAALLDTGAPRSGLPDEAPGAGGFGGTGFGSTGDTPASPLSSFAGLEASEVLPGGVDPQVVARKLSRALIWKYAAVTVL